MLAFKSIIVNKSDGKNFIGTYILISTNLIYLQRQIRR